MDLGCYGLHAHRALGRWAGGEPELVGARAKERAGAPGVDEWLEADLRFPSGVTGTVRASMVHPRFEMTLRVVGSRGEVTIMDFVQPHKDDRVLVRTGTDARIEHMGTRSSYIYQLEELITALRGGWRMPTDADDAVATAQLIDQCYRAADLPLRPRKPLQRS
jgi:predicted dehydrogenase